jgi:hypothetical protein
MLNIMIACLLRCLPELNLVPCLRVVRKAPDLREEKGTVLYHYYVCG